VSAPLEYQSLLPSVLLGDAGDDGRRGRSTRDWLVDVAMFLIAIVAGGGIFAEAVTRDPPPAGLIVADVVAGSAAIIALWWRRRRPVHLAVVIALVSTFSALAAMAGLIALFTVAVHRPFRTVAAVAALGILMIPVYYAVRSPENSFLVETLFGVLLTIAAVAWGMFVRARRQLVLSLRERAQRAESEQALRVEQARRMERDRIAREMHDVLAHRISLVSLHAGALEYASGSASPEDVAKAAGVIRSSAHEALEDLREVIGVLREDGALNGQPERPQPTLADLDALLEESRAAGMRVQRVNGSVAWTDVPTSVGRSAYRVVQEGLTNARKHAPGCAVAVSVSGKPGDGLEVEVRNPMPVGQVAPEIPGAGTGIVGLTERVALAGGRLEHGPAGDEWRLRAWLPWPAP
jgi:signal transduction histidine kinase